MVTKIIKPSEFLSKYIKYYWLLETDSSEDMICERVIPTGNIEIMFHYKKMFKYKISDTFIAQPRSFISGIRSDYIDVFTSGESGVIAVTFFPFGACNFFDFPLMEIENRSVSLQDINSHGFRQIEEQICVASSLSKRISVIEQYLLSHFRPVQNDELKLIKEGLELINRNRGQVNASNLSESLYLTTKSLQRKFSSLVGKTPKQFSRIVRFQEIIRTLSSNKNLTEIAIDNGYFDQAHFIKDFKSLSGYTPKEFLNYCPCQADYFQ